MQESHLFNYWGHTIELRLGEVILWYHHVAWNMVSFFFSPCFLTDFEPAVLRISQDFWGSFEDLHAVSLLWANRRIQPWPLQDVREPIDWIMCCYTTPLTPFPLFQQPIMQLHVSLAVDYWQFLSYLKCFPLPIFHCLPSAGEFVQYQ